jgi:hypothetical protein
MANAVSLQPVLGGWRSRVLPKEHGSWSLALEPLAFGLIAAPSLAGGWLALAVAAGFFARRPLRAAWRERQAERRAEARGDLLVCGLVAAAGLGSAIAVAGLAWIWWLIPAALAGAVFVSFDLRNAGRAEVAEVAGAGAFAWLAAPLAILGDATPGTALAFGLVMCGRAIPTVLGVRAVLRKTKTGAQRRLPTLLTAFAALAVGLTLFRVGVAPAVAPAALAILAARSVGLLWFPRPAFRARTIGLLEAVLGVAFVLAVALGWHA